MNKWRGLLRRCCIISLLVFCSVHAPLNTPVKSYEYNRQMMNADVSVGTLIREYVAFKRSKPTTEDVHAALRRAQKMYISICRVQESETQRKQAIQAGLHLNVMENRVAQRFLDQLRRYQKMKNLSYSVELHKKHKKT